MFAAEVARVACTTLLGLLGPPEPEADSGGDDLGVEAPAEAEPEAEGEPSPPTAEMVVRTATGAVQDRAYLERTNSVIATYVDHLDALAEVESELDGCGRALQAELRMALALAYLKLDGTCSQDGQVVETSELRFPQSECPEAVAGDPSTCAAILLDRVVPFAEAGPGGVSAPFSQAFGCRHAVAEMSVEQMFGGCMVGAYDEAIDRGAATPPATDQPEPEVWPVPRWASIVGVSTGAALIVTGSVLLGINGNCPGGYDPVTQIDQCPSTYNTDEAGGVFLGIGLAGTIAMGTVLTVTEIQRKRQRRHRESAALRRLRRAEAVTGLRLLPQPLRTPPRR